jgi:hypothetical protein
MTLARIPVPLKAVDGFCRKWGIAELALFGSVLREDFGPQSDVDVLVEFHDDAPASLWDWPDMEAELGSILERTVQLVPKSGLHNPFLRQRILQQREVLFGAR